MTSDTYLARLGRRVSHLRRGRLLAGPLSRLRAAPVGGAPDGHRHERDYLRRILGGGMCFVEVGVGEGQLTLLAAEHLPQGRVLAFEPRAGARQALERQLERAGFDHVRVFDQALGAGHGGDDSRLDDVVAQHGLGRLDILKVDAQGGELDVLRGAGETLARLRPTLIVRVDAGALGAAGYSSAELLDALAELGYRPHAFQPRHAHGTGELDRDRALSRAARAPLNLLCRPAER